MKLAKDETMHGALLDVNIDGGRIDDVAAILAERDVPFVFVTGYGRANLPPLFQDAVVVAKPFTDTDLLARSTADGAELIDMFPSDSILRSTCQAVRLHANKNRQATSSAGASARRSRVTTVWSARTASGSMAAAGLGCFRAME